MGDEKKTIYHERQRLQFCLLHSLNNLFQGKDAFKRAELNDIAEKLVLDDPTKATWTPLSVFFKPHHNAFTGNYDVNVLIAAVEGRGKKVIWHDRRNGASLIDLEGSEGKLMGIVLNVSLRKYAGLWRSRHWISLRKIEGVWYNLDSDLAAPYPFKDTEEIREFLDGVINGGAEVSYNTKFSDRVSNYSRLYAQRRTCIPVCSSRRDTDGKKTTISREENSSNRSKFSATCSRFRLPGKSELSPVKYLKHLGNKVVSVMRYVSTRTRSSTKVSSSIPSKPCLTPIDSRREEAISDCIEFINASSSLPRSNSVSC